jgi:ribose/xylose/arabinose/galactoside ABC-type transport system permease subunit
VAVCAGIGALVGWLIGATKLQPFIVTLAAMVTVRGVGYLVAGNRMIPVEGEPLAFVTNDQLGLPLSAWILLSLTLICAGVLKFSVFGRQIYAIGGNETAARFSGVRTNRVRIWAFAVNGLCIGIAAIIFTARTNQGNPNTGVGYELDAIAAVVIGGSALVGGVGNIFGTFVGALFMQCVNTLLQLKGIDPFVGIGMGLKGLLILAAVYLQNIGRSRT